MYQLLNAVYGMDFTRNLFCNLEILFISFSKTRDKGLVYCNINDVCWRNF